MAMLFKIVLDVANGTTIMPYLWCDSMHEMPCVPKVSVCNVAESISLKSSISASLISIGSGKSCFD